MVVINISNIPKDILVYLQEEFLDPVSSFQFSFTCKFLYNLYIQNVFPKFEYYHQYIRNKSWNLSLKKASKKNDWNIVLFLITKGADYWNEGMYSAAKGGYLGLIEYFIYLMTLIITTIEYNLFMIIFFYKQVNMRIIINQF
jgi:hypothetical protein